MARILHTADVHLTPDADERQRALATILSEADAANVDAVTSGVTSSRAKGQQKSFETRFAGYCQSVTTRF
jgi:hypothetical protein